MLVRELLSALELHTRERECFALHHQRGEVGFSAIDAELVAAFQRDKLVLRRCLVAALTHFSR